ncbi:MAG TPA: LuxR C-terminal-related transcriptional regulator [Conexibacter sp.]|jgi:LuxR family maltose regulon positive regulatory protein|nr:LuxR C-terminal-related transcriptional regulator [Conexibacter sp.]
MDATLPPFGPTLSIPRPRDRRTVPRPRLVQRLACAEPSAVLLLRAPAGYGKTSLLAQWTAAEPRLCVWVTVAGDPSAVIATIARALHVIEPVPSELRTTLTLERTVDRPLLDALSALLTARRRPFVLVLDDVHALRGEGATPLLELLGVCLDGSSQLVLAGRTDPPLPLARLRTEERLVELTPAQLALDDDEARQLLGQSDIELTPRDIEQVIACAEGWPAALVLAARAVDERRRQAQIAETIVTGADRLIADYVREQLLAELDPATRDLLLRGAPLGRLSGELCDGVLGRTGSGLTLRGLAHGNMPIAALDRDERRYRLHPLVATALLAELRCADPAWELEAHRRASAWCERHGDTARAIDHAVEAGDAHRAGALAWNALPAHALGRSPEQLDGWLAALGEERVVSLPTLALAAALRRLAAGHAADAARLAAGAERTRGGVPERSGCPLSGGIALVYAALSRAGVAQMRAGAESALASGVEQRAWRSLACLLAGVGNALAGRSEWAQDLLTDAAWQASSVPLVEALCLAQSALLALDRGEPERAVVLAERALACGEQCGVPQPPLFALVPAVAAFAHAQCGALDEGREALAHARRLLPPEADLPPWHEAQLRFALARTLLLLTDAAAARGQLARMSRALRQLPDAVVLHVWIEDAWARADAFAASAVRGPARLTLAELRVLRLLPSHFSLREIAGRLEVSANTVKTQAQAVYRKLDVSSRSEAVARAREVGLVDGSP